MTPAKTMRGWLIDILPSVAAGATIWALSPVIAGTPEPWDAENFYYVVSLATAGMLLGFVRPRRIWLHYPGVIAGQLIYMLLFLPLAPLLVLGVVFLTIYSLLTLAGAAIGLMLHRLIGGSARAVP